MRNIFQKLTHVSLSLELKYIRVDFPEYIHITTDIPTRKWNVVSYNADKLFIETCSKRYKNKTFFKIFFLYN